MHHKFIINLHYQCICIQEMHHFFLHVYKSSNYSFKFLGHTLYAIHSACFSKSNYLKFKKLPLTLIDTIKQIILFLNCNQIRAYLRKTFT